MEIEVGTHLLFESVGGCCSLNMLLAYRVLTQIWKRTPVIAGKVPKFSGVLRCTGTILGELDLQHTV